MPNPSNDLIIELLEEEIANLMFLAERHQRWGLQVQTKDPELSRKHRQAADRLKDAAEMNQALIEELGYRER